MSKHTLIQHLCLGTSLALGLVALGCSEKPDMSFSEYGETIDHLPVVKDLPLSFPIVDEFDKKDCKFREDAEISSRQHLLESQGRTLELQEFNKEHGRDPNEHAHHHHDGETDEHEHGDADKSTVEEPVVEEPAVEEPAVEEPAVEEPAVEEPAVEEPAVEEPAVEEPAVEEPAVEEPAVEEPAVEESAVEEPVVEAPAAPEA